MDCPFCAYTGEEQIVVRLAGEDMAGKKIGKRKADKRKNGIWLILILFFSTAGLWYAEKKLTEYERKPEFSLGNDTGKETYHNAWLLSWKEGELIFLAEDEIHSIEAETEKEYKDVIADLHIEGKKLVSITIKPEVIRGKVLSVSETAIELEGYGKVPVAEEFHIYRNYGEIGEGYPNEIIVGYNTQSFFVGNGMICAALLEEEPNVSSIRVLLLNQDAENFHSQVILCSEEGLLIENIEKTESYITAPQTELWFYREEQSNEQRIWLIENSNGEVMEKKLLEGTTYRITAVNENRIQALSLKRQQGVPSYRGTLEVELRQEGYLLRNELSVEEYLYAVVPSEMPASYPLEALKAQAVCARSYACKNIMANSLSEYGAHVNDSTAFQVYNNIAEQETSTQAVNDTRGQIMLAEGEIVEAYYFSTSCGVTTDASIWGAGVNRSYIQGRFIEPENGNNSAIFQNVQELKEEETFRTFITQKQENDFDFSFPWYRWSICFTQEDLMRLLQKNGLDAAVGTPISVQVSRRGCSGIAEELQITGTEGTAVLEREYAIRAFLSPLGMELLDQNGSPNGSFAILPSGYFIIDSIQDEEKTVFQITGGGFGHGAGMSQNASKNMAEQGYIYSDILKFFYSGIELSTFY